MPFFYSFVAAVALAFMAGAMVFVVVEEVTLRNTMFNTEMPYFGFIGGFIVMMILDVF
ncbi:MAG: hypothetical protein U5M50_09375 [Sphingobium sp.]|nr:hypothetical protein [Sphingobium sp.]